MRAILRRQDTELIVWQGNKDTWHPGRLLSDWGRLPRGFGGPLFCIDKKQPDSSVKEHEKGVRQMEPQAYQKILPDDVWKWKLLEQKFDQVLALYDYQEIRLSVLQDRDEIHKGLAAMQQEGESPRGGTVDIREANPDGTPLSLRPEGTISILHHTAGIHNKGEIHRYYYHGPSFRLDRAGNPVELNHLGVELLGSNKLFTENEVISLGLRILRELGLVDASLKLNSFGCVNCRPAYFEKMNAWLDEHAGEFCQNCLRELHANPFADTSCSRETCLHDTQRGPQITDHLCPECKGNLEKVKKIQANLTNSYRVDTHLYKSFAYYNETVFDFVVGRGENELVVGGGGRYDYLSAKITRKRIPAVGFYLDLNAIFALMERRSLFLAPKVQFAVYICAQSPNLEMMMLHIAQELHSDKIKTVLSAENNSSDAELAKARRHGCDLMIVLRDDNIREGRLLLRNIGREDQSYIPLNQISQSIRIARKSMNKD
jgi:histidyl-tRNA synthetase